MRVVAYFMPNKAITVPVHLLTHCILAFATIKPTGELAIPSSVTSWLRSTQEKRTKDPTWQRVKFQLAVGGWTGSLGFSDMAADREKRFNFVVSCARACIQYALDGIDLDWEYPRYGGLATTVTRPEDTANFTRLVHCLAHAMAATDRGKPILSAAIAADGFDRWALSDLAYYYPFDLLDYVNVMTYDYHGPWDESQKTVGHNAPIAAVRKSIQTLSKILDIERVNLGIPFYGRAWKTDGPRIGGKAFGAAGPDAGSMSYRDIASKEYDTIERIRRTEDGDAFRFIPGPGAIRTANTPAQGFNTIITFDDPETVLNKTKLSRELGCGGVMFWELSQDTPDWELLRTINQGWNL